ncbi:hypothetical protein CCACVL1_22068 [Corchorus capsularis]|uniref:Uncharacterized protein n=1 Tax=Corchorus capsularis TaxID=210143 RepID=A0A1R3H137_COCAP|nr:hypothetical protein CCACVL1_22068 [Corchorus capsularis]
MAEDEDEEKEENVEEIWRKRLKIEICEHV